MNKFWCLALICLASIGRAHKAGADLVSMLEESREIECTFAKSNSNYDRLVIDRKEASLTGYKDGKSVRKFERYKFLDTIFVAKASAGTSALVQILANGNVSFTEGELLPLMEKNCDDTGASKSCRTETISNMFWSPEKLTLTYQKQTYGGGLDQYGFLAGHATYFRTTNDKASVTLIDYGAAIELVVGPRLGLNCHYLAN